MKAVWSCGVALVVALSFEACTNADVYFSSPGVSGGGQAGAGASAGASPGAGAGGRGGAPAQAGAGGVTPEGGRADVSGGDGGANDAGNSGTTGGGGADNGGANNGGAGGAGGSSAVGGVGGSAGGTNDPLCGNQVLEGTEQCDDGNQLALDGCDAQCGFEQSQRSNWFKAQFATDAFCVANAFGSAFPPITRLTFQQGLDERVASGSFSWLFSFGDLADLSGANDSAVSLGMLYGSPSVGAGYDGTSDLDWWYAPSPLTVDASHSPVSKLAATITGGSLSVTSGKIELPLLSDIPLEMSGTALRLQLGASSKPLPSNGSAPGHLASEHLDPALESFASAGLQTAAGAGELCGNISAASLKGEAVPAAYIVGGATPCYQQYTAANTLLDVFVSGCTVAPGATAALNATQPDQVDATLPAAGSGGPYKLSANLQRVVNACRDKNNATVPLATCLNAAAYSSAFKFTTNRVIIK